MYPDANADPGQLTIPALQSVSCQTHQGTASNPDKPSGAPQ
ncbi:hypothetical protein MANY_02120 [Mycolicibacterium anyangense]|jgi:hypothetical protein|uniref:Uncharacterized protein n=1 Tax=Mycolicibacterium anyangense TaxID=1431246 RepID=A0A6N4W2I3_9MYCO|nr:hypothetical protein [Mycolicibacterium anyangense]BBZ74875.1 hypothetical protein MANY_02120 [Mycolicibacterium anyangense]